MFSCKFYEVFKNTFLIEALEVTASESSSQAVCLDIIIKTSKSRSSHRRCSVRKGVLKNFAKFKGTAVPVSLFCLSLVSPVNFPKFIKVGSNLEIRRDKRRLEISDKEGLKLNS